MIIFTFTCVFGGDVRRTEGVGETRLSTGTIFTDQLFTGQREMSGLGIYHYNARFYSSKSGRFLSADSIVPSAAIRKGLIVIRYVGNNPLGILTPVGIVLATSRPSVMIWGPHRMVIIMIQQK